MAAEGKNEGNPVNLKYLRVTHDLTVVILFKKKVMLTFTGCDLSGSKRIDDME